MGKSVQHIQNSLLSLLECLMIVLFVVLNLEVEVELKKAPKGLEMLCLRVVMLYRCSHQV